MADIYKETQRHTSTHNGRVLIAIRLFLFFFVCSLLCQWSPICGIEFTLCFFYDDQSVLYNLYQIDINCFGLFISVRAVKILLHTHTHTPNYKIALWLYHKPWQQMCSHIKFHHHHQQEIKRSGRLMLICARRVTSHRVLNVNKRAATWNENKFYFAFCSFFSGNNSNSGDDV